MPITRTPILDDDLSGEVGTILDNAWKQELYDQIDAADLAGVQNSQTAVIINSATGTINDWAPAGMKANTHLEWTGGADLVITGIVNVGIGARFTFKNVSGATALFPHAHADSAVGNRFHNLLTGVLTPVAPGGWATWVNDGNTWVIVAHDQGTPVAYTPVLTAGAGVLSVASCTGRYLIRGRTVFVWIDARITNNGSGSGWLLVTLPFIAVGGGGVSGTEVGQTGAVLSAYVQGGTNQIVLRNFDGQYAGLAGRIYMLSGMYDLT